MQYLWIFLTVFFAFGTGRSIIAWTVGAYFFGWIALLAVIFLPTKQAALDARLAKINLMAGKMLDQQQAAIVKKEIRDFDTVDDLFKQLEKK